MENIYTSQWDIPWGKVQNVKESGVIDVKENYFFLTLKHISIKSTKII